MSNAYEADQIGKILQAHDDPNVRALGRNLQGMSVELRRDEKVAEFVRSEGGDEALARILVEIEAKRIKAERMAAEILASEVTIPPAPFASNVTAINASVAMSRAGWAYGGVAS